VQYQTLYCCQGLNLTKEVRGLKRDAESVEGDGMERGCFSRLGGLGSVISSPRGSGAGRKRVLVHFEIEGTHLVTTNFVFVKCLRDILTTPKVWEEMSSKCTSHSQALTGAVKAPICHCLVVPVNERGMGRGCLQPINLVTSGHEKCRMENQRFTVPLLKVRRTSPYRICPASPDWGWK